MKALYVTNMYPVEDYAYYGIHVKEQIESLELLQGVQAGVYFIDGRVKKLNYLTSIFNVNKEIKKGNYDVVHVHYGISGLFTLLSNPKVPLVITLHSGELFSKKGFINRTLQRLLTLAIIKKAKKIIVLNDETVSLLESHRDKVVKLPCGIDIDFFAPLGVSKKGGSVKIGFPGNKARPEKNHPLFLEVIEKLKSAIKVDVEVVEFHNMTRKEVLKNLNKIDLLLMTSSIEGSPQIIKEAMACNTPIVSTAVGDVEDLLKDVTNSYTSKSFDADELVGLIKKILYQAADQRSSNGRSKLLAMGLDSTSVAGRIKKIYDAVV